MGDRGLDADRAGHLRRLRPVGGGAPPVRRVAGQPDPRRVQPGGEEGNHRQRERDGVVLLSRQAGVLDQLADHVTEVHPFDIDGTADALAAALATPADERQRTAAALREAAVARAHGLARGSAGAGVLTQEALQDVQHGVRVIDDQVGLFDDLRGASLLATATRQDGPALAARSASASNAARSPWSSPMQTNPRVQRLDQIEDHGALVGGERRVELDRHLGRTDDQPGPVRRRCAQS